MIIFHSNLANDILYVGLDNLINKLDITSDVFNTADLLKAYSKIDNSCKYMSMKNPKSRQILE